MFLQLFLKKKPATFETNDGYQSQTALVEHCIRNLSRNCSAVLPPFEMITKGSGRTFGAYWDDWWRTFDVPDRVINEEFVSWDSWFTMRFGMGEEFTRALNDVEIGLQIPDQLRTQAHMIMAPPDHGKTTYMENLIMDDVATGATTIVMDSQDGMIKRLLRALPEDRVVYLDGSALERPLSLSAFNLGRTDRLSDEIKVARSLDMFENMFSSMDFKFTMKQSTLFRELCRFLAAIPKSGFDTAIDILQNGYQKHFQYLYQLPDSTRDFIATHLGPPQKGRGQQSDYAMTRREVEARFRSLGTSPALLRMLNAPSRKVNIAKEINSHKIILINTAQGTLSPSGASLLGRYFLMQIALEVLARPESNDPIKRVCFYIDEAQEYFSNSNLLSLLMEQGRKRGLCLTMAFHHLGQLQRAGEGLTDVVRALTAIKSIKAANASDARAMGGDMQVEPTELQNVKKRHFMVHCRDIGSTVFKIKNSKDRLKPRRDVREMHKMIERMNNRYGYDPRAVPKPTMSKPSLNSGTIDPDAPQNFD